MTTETITMNIDQDVLHKELDLVQACITRMASNSFQLKEWAYALVGIVIGLTAEKIPLWIICLIGIFFLLNFWILDAFFLKCEQLYRDKYNWIIQVRLEGNSEFLYDLNPYKKETRLDNAPIRSIPSAMINKPFTLLLFYGLPIIIGIAIMILNAFGVLI